jgi:hypothetical protein
VRLCLQGELVSAEEREKLWNRAKRKNPFYIGFLHADAMHIPLPAKPHRQHAEVSTQLATLTATGNPYANAFSSTLSSTGQNWLRTLQLALEKPVDQEVVISLFIAIDKRFPLPLPESRGVRDLNTALQRAEAFCHADDTCPPDAKAVRDTLNPNTLPLFKAMLILAQMGEDSLIPYFGGNDSVGSVMRKRLEPLTKPLLAQTQVLIGK